MRPRAPQHGLAIPAALAAILSFLAAWSAAVDGQPVWSATEQSIKAAYLYRFADYVEWPGHVFGEKSDPLTIGVFGADALADELGQMTAGRTVNGRRIRVRTVTGASELSGVHILFVSAASDSELPALADAAAMHSVLVVTESGDGLERGGVINFRPVDQRIRFDVSLDSAARNRLRLNARLLAVADHVQQRRP